MSDAATQLPDASAKLTARQLAWAFLAAAVVLTLSQYAGLLPEWLHRLPQAVIPNFAGWLDAIFNYVKDDMGLLTLTRFLTGGLETLLDASGNIFYGKRRWPNLGPIPWTALAMAVAVTGYYLGGWKLALLGGVTLTWTALMGQWKIAMETVSVLTISVPLAFVIGLSLGIAAWKYARVDAVIKSILSVLQTLPFFTYLLPAVIFFKVGPTAGAVATTIYAIPPMILMTTLGLQKVSPEVVEAGKMSGCSRFQMLRHVYIPAARTEILVGVNQVIMLSLAMVVLTSFIGMPGLGAKLIQMLGSFKLGRSFEVGVTIVLLAVTLDRMSKAWVVKQPEHFERGTAFWARHKTLLVGTVLVGLCFVLAQFIPFLGEVGRGQDFSIGKPLDKIIRGFLDIGWVKSTTGFLRAFLNVQVLIPFRNFLLSIPTPAVILLVAAFAFALAGRKQAVYAVVFFSLVALSGWWDRAIITLYSVISAVTLAALVIWFGYGDAGRYTSYEGIATSDVFTSISALPGDYIYEDWNEDGIVDGNDRYPIATTSYPLMNFGISLGAQYKNFDLNMLFQGASMYYIGMGEQLAKPFMWEGNALEQFKDRWHPTDPNMDPYNPANEWVSGNYAYGAQAAETDSEFGMQNGTYVRLKNIELGYTIPKNILNKVKIEKARLFVNGYNLFTLTGVEGIDPEKPEDLNGYMYPLNQTINFGAEITF